MTSAHGEVTAILRAMRNGTRQRAEAFAAGL